MLYQFLLFSKVNQLFFRCCCSVTKLCPTLCNQWIAARQSSLCPTISQSWKAIHICICIPLFWISFPFRSLQSTEQSSLCYTVGSHYLSTLYIVSIVYACQSQSPNSSIPSSPPWCPYVCSLYLRLQFCFVIKIIHTNFFSGFLVLKRRNFFPLYNHAYITLGTVTTIMQS